MQSIISININVHTYNHANSVYVGINDTNAEQIWKKKRVIKHFFMFPFYILEAFCGIKFIHEIFEGTIRLIGVKFKSIYYSNSNQARECQALC